MHIPFGSYSSCDNSLPPLHCNKSPNMFLFYSDKVEGARTIFEQQEAVHIQRVLRRKVGDIIHWTDGKGYLYSGPITAVSKREITASVQNKEHWKKTWTPDIHIAVCPTKNIQRMEWMVEKLCEIGVDTISLVIAHNSERRNIKIPKLQRKVISACTQSLKTQFPVLNTPVSFEDYIKNFDASQRGYIAHCREALPPLSKEKDAAKQKDVHILIGPEGDFTAREVESALSMGWIPVGLGAARLRTETAALAACHTLHLLDQLRGE